jgi:hypothetical protein
MRGYKPGFSNFGTTGDRVVGDEEFFRGKIRNWEPNPDYGVDKMRIPKDDFMQELQRLYSSNRLRRI